MASPLLDFKKFTHVKSDDTSTTLKHKDGHTLNIMHNALSKPNQEQLKALSKLPVQSETEPQKQEAKADSKSEYGKVSVKEEPKVPNGKVKVKLAEGSDDLKYSEGTEPKYGDSNTDTRYGKSDTDTRYAKGGAVCMHCGGGLKKYANPTEAVSKDDSAPEQDDSSIEADLPAGGVVNIGENPMQVPNMQDESKKIAPELTGDDKTRAEIEESNKALNPDEPVPTAMPATGNAQPPADIAQAPAAPVTPSDMGDQTSMLQNAYKEQQAGAAETGKANAELGTEQAKIHENAAKSQEDAKLQFQNSYKELNDERLAHIKDIQNGYIDPSKYWDNHSKLATGIGMILAGFNPTGQPNAAIDFLKHQMDQNIQAQAKNLSAKENLLSANLHQFGNLRDAADMTRVMQADYVSHKLNQAASTAQSPLAAAAAKTAAGKIDQEFAPLFMNLTMRKAAMNLANSSGDTSNGAIEHLIASANAIGNPMGKTLSEAYIPGVGISRTLQPIPQPTKDTILAMKILDDKGKDLLSFIQKHKGIYNNEQDKSVALQKMEEMKNFYNGSIQGGALTAGRLGWYDEQFSKHPLNALSQFVGSTKKLEEMVNSNGHRLNMTLDQSGIKPMQSVGLHQQQQPQAVNHNQAISWAKAHPNDPRAVKILQLQGK